MTEFDFIRQYLQQQPTSDVDLILGIGDDAAIFRPKPGYDCHISADMLLGNKHFFLNTSPQDLAHKILAVNLSDMAAMGASPRWFLLSAALPSLDKPWLEEFCTRLFTVSQEYNLTLIGGDTTKGDWIFNVTIIGETPSGLALKRSGAQVNDEIWVSGKIGLSAAALNHHWGKITLPRKIFEICEEQRLRPIPRVALGKELLNIAHAAQDISDGLAQDLSHILTSSQVGAEINIDLIPTHVDVLEHMHNNSKNKSFFQECLLSGGDDYELIFTAPTSAHQEILTAAQRSHTPVVCIGRITNGNKLDIHDTSGNIIKLNQQGFDHFA